MGLALGLAGGLVGLGAVAPAAAHGAGGPGPWLALAHFPEGPPARVTGGFGEDTCAACHFSWDEAPAPGRMKVAGFPECYESGASYDLTIVVQDPDMKVAGFQLSIRRAADGAQAGLLAVPEPAAHRVAIRDDAGLLLAQHRLEGSQHVDGGAARWPIRWTAPDAATPLLLHAAALAGDGDRSQAGDRTYQIELPTNGARCEP